MLNDSVVLLGTENSSFACPTEFFSCNNFPRPLQPLPTMVSYVTCVMLRALLSWLESRDCFQACISHFGSTWCGWWAICRIPFLSNIRVGVWHWIREQERGEWTVQWSWRYLLGVFVHFSVVIAYDWYSVLVVIEWQRFCFFLSCFKWLAWCGNWKIFSYFFLSSAVCLQVKNSVWGKSPKVLQKQNNFIKVCVFV